MRPVLILGSTGDDLIRLVIDELNGRKTRAYFVEEQEVYSSLPFAFARTGNYVTGQLVIDGDAVSLTDISGVLVRLPREWWPGPEFDVQDQMFVYHESTAAWFNVLSSLPCPVINRFGLAWWLQDLNYPLQLIRSFSHALELAAMPLEASLPYNVRLLPTVAPNEDGATSIYAVAGKLLPSSTGLSMDSRLQRRLKGLAGWQEKNQLPLCRLDFVLNGEPRLKRVEPFPSFQNEDSALTQRIASAVADIVV